jgi:hypothetical protein
MITITDEMIADARNLIANGTPEAVGYRLMMFTIDATTGMEEFEKAEYETLAAAGFQTSTEEQTDKLSRGSYYGVLISKGDQAFKGEACGDKDWVDEGDLLIFDRYAGVEIEMPPGSGQMMRFTNDESVLGRMK